VGGLHAFATNFCAKSRLTHKAVAHSVKRNNHTDIVAVLPQLSYFRHAPLCGRHTRAGLSLTGPADRRHLRSAPMRITDENNAKRAKMEWKQCCIT
jgi:hypothetical protein